jgi:hypothetical protein
MKICTFVLRERDGEDSMKICTFVFSIEVLFLRAFSIELLREKKNDKCSKAYGLFCYKYHR